MTDKDDMYLLDKPPRMVRRLSVTDQGAGDDGVQRVTAHVPDGRDQDFLFWPDVDKKWHVVPA